MLAHVIVKKGSEFVGRYAVLLEDDFLKMKTVAGEALRHELLVDVMQAVDEDCLLRASKLHEERKRPWRVCVRKGRSGCKDFWIEYLINTELKIIGKGGRLHISMNGKLNEGLDIPLMDLAPILHHQNFPEGWEQEHPEYSFEVISESDLPKIGDFYPAGTDEYGEEDIPVEEIQIKDEEE